MLRYGHCSTVLYLLAGALIHLTSRVAQNSTVVLGAQGCVVRLADLYHAQVIWLQCCPAYPCWLIFLLHVSSFMRYAMALRRG